MFVLLLLLSQAATVCCSVFSANSSSLKSSLLLNYDKDVRPDQTTTVDITMVVKSLNKLDTASQSMAITVLWFMIWQDDRFQWDPAVYNTDSLAFSTKNVWTPPLVITNEVDNIGMVGSEGVPLRAFASGQVLWIPPSSIETSCVIKIYSYPFDIQTCVIEIVGWTLSISEMNIVASDIELSMYAFNGEWALVNVSTESKEFDGGFGKLYRSIEYSLTFRRLWPFYGLTLICPLALLSLLMAGAFAVPVESGEKIGYSLTVLLSFTVLMTLISDSLPAISTDTSVLQVYASIVLILGGVVTVLIVIVVRIHHRDPSKPVSRSVLRFYSILSRCLCKSKPEKVIRVKPEGSPELDEGTVTWQDVSRRLDAVCFRFMTFISLALLVVVLFLLYGGYYGII